MNVVCFDFVNRELCVTEQITLGIFDLDYIKLLIHSNVSWDLNLLTPVSESDLLCVVDITAWNYGYWAL